LGLFKGHYDGVLQDADAFGAWLGKRVQTVTYFIGMVDASGGWSQVEGHPWLLNIVKKTVDSGRKASLALTAYPTGMGITLAQVGAGQHDAHYTRLANNLAAHGLLDIELRLSVEHDGDWFDHSAPPGSGKEAAFVAHWRRIVSVMRAAQPNNKWVWVWNPTDHRSHSRAYLESTYPGDAYVDQIGINCYDQYEGYYPSGSDRLTRQQWVWANFRAPRLETLAQMARDHGKPIQFPEWGLIVRNGTYASSSGGDNPYYIQKMHEFFMNPTNNVVMHSYFDIDYSDGSILHKISPTTRFPQASAKFKQLFGAGAGQ
jgi:beta-mannanase